MIRRRRGNTKNEKMKKKKNCKSVLIIRTERKRLCFFSCERYVDLEILPCHFRLRIIKRETKGGGTSMKLLKVKEVSKYCYDLSNYLVFTTSNT